MAGNHVTNDKSCQALSQSRRQPKRVSAGMSETLFLMADPVPVVFMRFSK